jgi:hypothetical protein
VQGRPRGRDRQGEVLRYRRPRRPRAVGLESGDGRRPLSRAAWGLLHGRPVAGPLPTLRRPSRHHVHPRRADLELQSLRTRAVGTRRRLVRRSGLPANGNRRTLAQRPDSAAPLARGSRRDLRALASSAVRRSCPVGDERRPSDVPRGVRRRDASRGIPRPPPQASDVDEGREAPRRGPSIDRPPPRASGTGSRPRSVVKARIRIRAGFGVGSARIVSPTPPQPEPCPHGPAE